MGKRSRWKKIFTPLVLAILGLLLLLSARLEYPSATIEVGNASLSELTVRTDVPVTFIDYTIFRLSPATIDVSIRLVPAGKVPRGASRKVNMYLNPPGPGYGTFMKMVSFRSHGGDATANFIVKTSRPGVTYNGITASASIPRVIFQGPGTPSLVVQYSIPSASSYDWSSFPPSAVTNSLATWEVYLAKVNIAGQPLADTLGQIAVGINHSAQVSDDRRTFYAGALLGLAGGAILSAVQEALSRFVG